MYNNCYGGFSLSPIAQKEYAKLKNIDLTFYKQTKYSFDKETGGIDEYVKIINIEDYDSSSIYAFTKDYGDTFYGKYEQGTFYCPNIKRDDPDLVTVVEKLGKKANGTYANLAITEVEGKWRIDEYDGKESVKTPDSYQWND